jgi:ribosomal-protein-alanine N-acetyltransferase
MYSGWASDENVTKYVSWDAHRNKDETLKIITGWVKAYENNSYNWVVEIKETHELIGSISAISVSRKHHNCEIGYCYGSKYWNQGFATEALKAVINYMLNDCEMHVVEAKHYSTNPPSGRVMEKSGMIKEAVLKERRYNECINSYGDLVCYYVNGMKQ